MDIQPCLICNAATFHEATIGTVATVVVRVCLCGKQEVKPEADIVQTLAIIRAFYELPC